MTPMTNVINEDDVVYEEVESEEDNEQQQQQQQQQMSVSLNDVSLSMDEAENEPL